MAEELGFNIRSLRVVVSRLKKKGKIKVVNHKEEGYVYTISKKTDLTNKNNEDVWLAFKELFIFFMDVMKNQEELNIENVKLWNKLYQKRNEEIIIKVGEELIE